jgi:hypothetical protein
MNILNVCVASCALVYASAFAQPQSDTASVESREGAVFGLLLGKDNSKEVASRVQLPERSICKIVSHSKECQSTYEIATLGYLRSKDTSIAISPYVGIPPTDAGVFFAKFSVDGEHLFGTFYNDTLIAIAVTGKYSDTNLDSDVDTKSLLTSFNKKYKKVSTSVKTSTQDGVTDKYTYYVWKDSEERFEVHFTRHDSILVNKLACLSWLRGMAKISIDMYKRLEHKCEGSYDEYQLEYRAPQLYGQAFEQSRKLEAEVEARKKNETSNRVNRY